VIPDGEKITGKFLRERPAMTNLGARVVGKTPEDTSTPWVRLTQLDAKSVGGHRSDHLVEFYFQLDCYAGEEGGQPEASLLTRTVREELTQRMVAASHTGAVVTGVDVRSAPRIPDRDWEPARERFVMTVLIWMRGA
jgi:hypothetical protein